MGGPQTYFQGGRAKTYYLPKNNKKDPSKNSQKHTLLAGQGGGGAGGVGTRKTYKMFAEKNIAKQNI